MNLFNSPSRCKKCKRVLSDRGKPNKSGYCYNCFRQTPENKEKMVEWQKKYRLKKKLEKIDNIKNKNE